MQTPSLSARRAWIEMRIQFPLAEAEAVALRKESVDRNQKESVTHETFNASLSARRAWIEISILRGEGLMLPGRSPQGERG